MICGWFPAVAYVQTVDVQLSNALVIICEGEHEQMDQLCWYDMWHCVLQVLLCCRLDNVWISREDRVTLFLVAYVALMDWVREFELKCLGCAIEWLHQPVCCTLVQPKDYNVVRSLLPGLEFWHLQWRKSIEACNTVQCLRCIVVYHLLLLINCL